MEVTKIVIIGGRGTATIIAEQIYDAIHRFNVKLEVLGFAIDDEAYGGEINGFPIVSKTFEAKTKFEKFSDVRFIYSLYRPDIMHERIALRESYKIPIEKYYTFIHPSAYIAKSSKIENGTVVLANAVINTNAKIGVHCTINSGTLIGHDTIIGESNYFAAQVCVGSNIKMGNGNFVGMNSSLRNFITVQDFSIIGMSSVVTSDIGNERVYYGNPAKDHGKLNNPIR